MHGGGAAIGRIACEDDRSALGGGPLARDELSPPSPIRVVLAENHALLRDGLRLLLGAEEGIEVIAKAEALESARVMSAAEVRMCSCSTSA